MSWHPLLFLIWQVQGGKESLHPQPRNPRWRFIQKIRSREGRFQEAILEPQGLVCFLPPLSFIPQSGSWARIASKAASGRTSSEEDMARKEGTRQSRPERRTDGTGWWETRLGRGPRAESAGAQPAPRSPENRPSQPVWAQLCPFWNVARPLGNISSGQFHRVKWFFCLFFLVAREECVRWKEKLIL